MNVLPFMLPYVVPAAILISHISGASWGVQAVVWIYLAAAMLDVFPGPKRPVETGAGRGWRLAIWLWTPAHMAALASGLSAVGSRALAQEDTATMLLQTGIALGMTGGMFGVVVAHELMHRSSRWEGLLAETLMIPNFQRVILRCSFLHSSLRHGSG